MTGPYADCETLLDSRDDSALAEPVSDDLVSVAVSLFDYGAYLPECLESVAAQRHAALELIVVDDASRDNSAAVAADWMHAYQDRFVRALLLRHRHNRGLAEARNTGFAAARANWVFVLDADNAIYPRAIGRLHEVMRRGHHAVAYSQLEFFGDELTLGFADLWSQSQFERANHVDAMALVSRQAWREVGGYTHLDGGWEDYDFWCKFIEHGLEGAFVPEILCRYRVHAGSMLRTEHRRLHEELALRMLQRHPWLRI